MPKFFVGNEQIQDGKIMIIGEDVNHIVNVLRLKEQDEIQICDKDNGITYQSEIVEVLKEKVECKMITQIEQQVESNVAVTIFQGLPKADKMEYIIQKTTEIGGIEIVPVAMKRCIVKLEGKDENKKIERWQKIAEVAAKQSGRDKIPHIHHVIKFGELKELVSSFDLFIVAYENEERLSLKRVLNEKHIDRIKLEIENRKNAKPDYDLKDIIENRVKETIKIGVVIGPEGGLDKEEVEMLSTCGAKVVTLGNRILRTETAPIVILSNIMYEFDE